MSDKPNPGSQEAIDAGCICPVLDNRHGRGAYINEDGKPVFWYTRGCPVHGKETKNGGEAEGGWRERAPEKEVRSDEG